MTAVTKYEHADAANPGLVPKIIPARGNTGGSPDYTFATAFTYFATGPTAGMLEQLVDPLGNTTTFEYDAVGRKISSVDPLGNGSGGVPADHRTEYVYNSEDRLRFLKLPAPTAGGSQIVTETRFDEVGNPVVRIDANGQVTTYAYDNRDGLFQVKESPDAWTDPATPPTGVITTEYAYDAAGQMIRVTRAKGNGSHERVAEQLYDARGLIRRESQYPAWPSTSGALVTTTTNDATGNLATVADALGRTTSYGYDTLNRPISVDYSSAGTADVTYSYDANGNRTAMSDGTGSTTYAYDEADRLTSVTTPGPTTVGYRYDLDDNRTKLLYPDSTAVTYAFDKAGQLDSLTDWASRTVDYTYLADGLPQTAANPNGTVTNYTHDNARRTTDISHVLGSTPFLEQAYTLDSVGNVVALDEGVDGWTYAYDRLDRLTGVTGPDGARTYGYDPVGNRTSKVLGGATAYTYDRADRITSAGSATITLDANGNTTANGADTFAYDQENRLLTANVAGATETYVYDGDGVRFSRQVGAGPAIRYVSDVAGSLPVTIDDGTRKYVWGKGLAYAVSGSTLEVYHSDRLGSVRVITDGAGATSATYRTDEFGVPTSSTGSNAQPYGFTGEPADATGLTYLRARYYDPVVARFLSRDTWSGGSSTQSLNRYAYVGNNPVTRIDPTGHCWNFVPQGALVGASGGSVVPGAGTLAGGLSGAAAGAFACLGILAVAALVGEMHDQRNQPIPQILNPPQVTVPFDPPIYQYPPGEDPFGPPKTPGRHILWKLAALGISVVTTLGIIKSMALEQR